MAATVRAGRAGHGKQAGYSSPVAVPTREFIEAVFTRVELVDRAGAAAIYAHREYGRAVGNEVSAWIEE
ncbi:hypothetical protein NX905_29650, partial [Burkholderia thailandensis]|nr:hypothetical protein [Burkholderia thailandensis]